MFHFPGISGGGAVIQCTMYVVMIDRNTPQIHFPLRLGLTLRHSNSRGLAIEEGISGEAFPLEKKSTGVTQMNRRGAAFLQI